MLFFFILVWSRWLSDRISYSIRNHHDRQTNRHEYSGNYVAVSRIHLFAIGRTSSFLSRKILALYQRWQVSIPKTKFSTQWEDDFKRTAFGGLFEEYLEMGKRISSSKTSPFPILPIFSLTIRFHHHLRRSISYSSIICSTE